MANRTGSAGPGGIYKNIQKSKREKARTEYENPWAAHET